MPTTPSPRTRLADAAADTDEADDELEDDEAGPEDDGAAPVAAAAAGAAAAGSGRRVPRGLPARKPAAAPTVSEQAVRVDDRASAIFVLAIVGVFVAIFVLAMLFGSGSFFGNVFKGSTPTPAPTVEVTAAPSESASSPGRVRLAERVRFAGREPVGRTLAEPLGELTPGPMTRRPEPASEARARMVRTQLRDRGIRDERVLEVMSTLPREAFVPDDERRHAYADNPLPIGAGQTISQPYIVARMTELLAVAPGERVLEVGTGSGYQAVVLAELGCRVTTIEREAGLAASARARLEALGYGADRIDVRTGDGTLGLADEAPWDGILVAAAAPEIPVPLREQLGEGRRLVIPVGGRREQQLLVVERHGDEWREWSDGPCVFVPLIGESGWES